jgi:hypothetical protein
MEVHDGQIGRVHRHRSPGGFPDRWHPRQVVDMTMGEQDPVHLQAVALDQVQHRLVLQPRIDDHRGPAVPAAQDVAVLGKQRVSEDRQLKPFVKRLGRRHLLSLRPDSG